MNHAPKIEGVMSDAHVDGIFIYVSDFEGMLSFYREMEDRSVIGGVKVRVVELTGAPGDAVLWHPALLHSRSQNRSDAPKFVLR